MPSSNPIVLLLIACLATASVGAQDDSTFDLDDLEAVLEPGDHRVDVLQLAYAPRMIELTARLQRAIRENQEWWMDHVKKARPGEPLPYDERMGLTREEYGEFLALSGSTTMTKVGEATISVRRLENGALEVAGGNDLPDLDRVIVEVEGNRARTSVGVLSEVSRIRASRDQKATGPWNGYGWTRSQGSPDRPLEGKLVKAQFVVGRMQEDGLPVIYYTARVIEDGVKTVSADVFIRFQR